MIELIDMWNVTRGPQPDTAFLEGGHKSEKLGDTFLIFNNALNLISLCSLCQILIWKVTNKCSGVQYFPLNYKQYKVKLKNLKFNI